MYAYFIVYVYKVKKKELRKKNVEMRRKCLNYLQFYYYILCYVYVAMNLFARGLCYDDSLIEFSEWIIFGNFITERSDISVTGLQIDQLITSILKIANGYMIRWVTLHI